MVIRGIPNRSRDSVPPFSQATLGVLDAYLPRFRANRHRWPRWHGDHRVWEGPQAESLVGSWPWTPQFLIYRLLKEADLVPWSVISVRRDSRSDEEREEDEKWEADEDSELSEGDEYARADADHQRAPDIEHPSPSLWVRLQAAYLSMAHSNVPETLLPESIEETYFVTPEQLVTLDFLGPEAARRIQARFERAFFDLQPRLVAYYERLATVETKHRGGEGSRGREQAHQTRADLIAEAQSLSTTLWDAIGLTPRLEKGRQLWVSDRAIVELESEAREIAEAIWDWQADPQLLKLAGELLAEDEDSADPRLHQDVGMASNLLRSGRRAEAAAREFAFPFLLPAEVDAVLRYHNRPATAAKQLLLSRLNHRVSQQYLGEIIRRELGRNTL